MEESDQSQPIIEPYVVRPAECRKYDPRAAEVARRIIDLVACRLPGVRVEHIGSTAVPGCDGKGIVDLMIPVADGAMETVKKALSELGFQLQPGPDPFPEDRPMRVGATKHDGETFLLHVHLIPAGASEIDDIRFFRSCLRADPELLRAYVARKKEIIASGATDSSEYCRLKGEFLKSVFG